jgi:hypothetical protein
VPSGFTLKMKVIGSSEKLVPTARQSSSETCIIIMIITLQLCSIKNSGRATYSHVGSFFAPPFQESLWVVQATYSANTTISPGREFAEGSS